MNEKFKYGKCIFANPKLENASDMVEMMNDPEIASMLFTVPKTFTYEDEVNWINKNQDSNCFSAFDINTHEYIGNGGFNEIDGSRGEIGLVIRKQMQGKKYAKDIINGLIDYGFNKLNLDEIYSADELNKIAHLSSYPELTGTTYSDSSYIGASFKFDVTVTVLNVAEA